MENLALDTETHEGRAAPAIGFFEKWLTAWVFACIVLGVALGNAFPALFGAIADAEVASVNLPVAILIWLMIIPMLLKIDFTALAQVKDGSFDLRIREVKFSLQDFLKSPATYNQQLTEALYGN